MLTKEELKDLYKRIDNLEADKTSLLSANKKLKESCSKTDSINLSIQKDHEEVTDQIRLLKEQLAQEKQLRAKVIIDYKKIVKATERTLEKQRKKSRNKQEVIERLRSESI